MIETNYFQWEINEVGKLVPKIIDEIIIDFFQVIYICEEKKKTSIEFNSLFNCTCELICTCNAKSISECECRCECLNKFNSECQCENDCMIRVLKAFYSDVMISSLNDSLDELVKFFNESKTKSKIKNFPILFDELFYDKDTFFRKMDYVLEKLDVIDVTFKKSIENIYHKEDIYLQIPKITLPLELFAIYYAGNKPWGKLTKLKKRYLPLIDSENEGKCFFIKEQYFLEAMLKIMARFRKLDLEKNVSLCFHLFNSYSNLYDVYNGAMVFSQNHNFMRSFVIQEELKKSQAGSEESEGSEESYELSKKEIKSEKKKYLGQLSKIGHLDMLEIKELLIKGDLRFDFLFNEDILDFFYGVFNECKISMKDAIYKHFKDNPILEVPPDELKKAYAVYSFLSKEEPYQYLVDNLIEEGIQIFGESGDNVDKHSLENYEIFYKLLREAKKIQQLREGAEESAQ